MELGILVDGDNHFIVRGPLPSPRCAKALAGKWSVIRIGSGVDMTRPEPGFPWYVSTKEFRENLQWAVVLPSSRSLQPGAQTLLAEMAARGVVIHGRDDASNWSGEDSC